MTNSNIPSIPGFEVLEKLGQGGMATVWKARQLSLDREVAIKVLLPRFAVDEEEVNRFRSEAQAAAKLKHLGIVQVYDANISEGSYYFIMEYIAGYTVGDWLRRKQVLSESDALLVTEHVCDALGYAWDHANVIHCDIKPDNIMIDDDGTVKVTDLGLARTLNAMSTFVEDDGYVLGTPAYMSPEQARGDAHLDFRSDIYSVGAMLYHLVTGHRLFSGNDESDTLELQITGTCPDAIELNGSISRPTCALIERMLAKNPDERGASWQAVKADVNRAFRGLMPLHGLPADTMSTVQRSNIWDNHTDPHDLPTRKSRRRKHRSWSGAVWLTLWGSVSIVAIAGAIRYYLSLAAPEAQAGLDGQPPALTDGSVDGQSGTMALTDAQRFQAALEWQRANPSDPDGAIARYNEVIRFATSSTYRRRAERCIRMMQAEKERLREPIIDKHMQRD